MWSAGYSFIHIHGLKNRINLCDLIIGFALITLHLTLNILLQNLFTKTTWQMILALQDESKFAKIQVGNLSLIDEQENGV